MNHKHQTANAAPRSPDRGESVVPNTPHNSSYDLVDSREGDLQFGSTFVDSIRLLFPDHKHNHLIHRNQRFTEGEAGHWHRVKGKFFLTVARIGPFRFRRGIFRPRGPVEVSVMFSPGNVRYGHNAVPISASDVGFTLNEMQKVAQHLGLKVNINEAKITEIHLARDVILARIPQIYLPVLHQFETPGCASFANFTSGIYRGSATIRWSIYDKATEVRHRLESCPNHRPAARLASDWLKGKTPLRFELRLRTADTINKQLGFKTPTILMSRYDECYQVMDKRLKKDLFRYTPLTSSERLQLESIQKPEGVLPYSPQEVISWNLIAMKDPIMALALRGHLTPEEGMDPGDIQRLLTQAPSLKRGKLSRDRTKIRLAQMHSLLSNGHLFADLYEELRTAVLNNNCVNV